MNPDAEWFCADENGGQYGPFSFVQVEEMTASGQIQPATKLWTEGLADWTQAVQIEGLFAAAPAPAPVNPYLAPGTSPAPQGTTDYPIPFVKKTSFGLYIGALLTPLLLGLIAFIIISLAASSDSADATSPSDLNQQHANAGTPEEIRLADEQLKDAGKPEYSNAEVGGGLAFMALMILAGASMMFAGIYAYIILFRAWYCLQPGGARTTPGAAVGFLFVPIYSLYWIFVAFGGWAKDWNRIRASYPNLRSTPVVSEGLFMTGVISTVTIIGIPVAMICFIIMHKQMCDAINSMVSLRNAAAMSKPGSLPSFY
ncbi:MAG: DUF4339 domain-containing protein [Akkermansiaceae bacterium]